MLRCASIWFWNVVLFTRFIWVRFYWWQFTVRWNMLCFICAAQLNFDFKLTSEAKIQPVFTGREDMPVHASCFWLFSPRSRAGHTLRPIFMLWLVKIWQLSSCGKFMQHLESCLLWELKLTEFCVNLWCFQLSCSTGCTKWNSAAIRSLLLFVASLFIWFLVESK